MVGHERLFAHLDAVVGRAGVGDHLPRVACGGQVPADGFIEGPFLSAVVTALTSSDLVDELTKDFARRCRLELQHRKSKRFIDK